MKIIQVCKGDSKYFLRLYVNARGTGVIRFETHEEFSKREADYRARELNCLKNSKIR